MEADKLERLHATLSKLAPRGKSGGLGGGGLHGLGKGGLVFARTGTGGGEGGDWKAANKKALYSYFVKEGEGRGSSVNKKFPGAGSADGGDDKKSRKRSRPDSDAAGPCGDDAAWAAAAIEAALAGGKQLSLKLLRRAVTASADAPAKPKAAFKAGLAALTAAGTVAAASAGGEELYSWPVAEEAKEKKREKKAKKEKKSKKAPSSDADGKEKQSKQASDAPAPPPKKAKKDKKAKKSSK